MPTLPLTPTTDTYNSLEFPYPCRSVTLTIVGGAVVIVQFKIQAANSPGVNPDWNGEERALVPGVWGYTPADFGGRPVWGVQWRNAAPGVVGTIGIEAG